MPVVRLRTVSVSWYDTESWQIILTETDSQTDCELLITVMLSAMQHQMYSFFSSPVCGIHSTLWRALNVHRPTVFKTMCYVCSSLQLSQWCSRWWWRLGRERAEVHCLSLNCLCHERLEFCILVSMFVFALCGRHVHLLADLKLRFFTSANQLLTATLNVWSICLPLVLSLYIFVLPLAAHSTVHYTTVHSFPFRLDREQGCTLLSDRCKL